MDKSPKFCIPIVKSSKKEVLEVIAKNLRDYDYFEVWLDHIEDLDLQFVKLLEKKLKNKLILLFRRQNLETPKMSEEVRHRILKSLKNSPIILDFDISSQEKDLKFVKKQGIKTTLITSHHDYKKTPKDTELTKILTRMKTYKPDVYKISAFCNEDTDALRLMNILAKLKAQKGKYIILGMGEKGMITRVYGILEGNFVNFAPKTLAEKSAPGQLTRKQLQDVVRTVSNNTN